MVYSIFPQINKGLRRISVLRSFRFWIKPDIFEQPFKVSNSISSGLTDITSCHKITSLSCEHHLNEKFFLTAPWKHGFFQKRGSSYTRQPGNASRSPLLRFTVWESGGNLSYAPFIGLTNLGEFYSPRKYFRLPNQDHSQIFWINYSQVDFIVLGIQHLVTIRIVRLWTFANKPLLPSN
jgi:hypothetical protein